MQPKIEKMISDPLERLEQLWPHLHPWQKTLILTRAVFLALPGFQEEQWHKHAHWVKTPYHWI